MELMIDLPYLTYRLESSANVTRTQAGWPEQLPFLFLSFSIRGISEAGIVWLFYWRGSNLRDITREKFCEESNPYLFQTENTAYLHDLKNIAT